MATEDPILKTLFSSQTRIEVLSHFFLHPEGGFYLRQLARLLGQPLTPLRRELQALEGIGLLRSSREGNQKRYALNPDFTLREELRAVFVKTTGAFPAIRAALEEVPGVRQAFVYGSWAAGEERPGSDIDVMVVGEASERDLSRVFAGLEERLGREINYSLYSEAEVRARQDEEGGFIHTVVSGPRVFLIGGGDEGPLRAD